MSIAHPTAIHVMVLTEQHFAIKMLMESLIYLRQRLQQRLSYPFQTLQLRYHFSVLRKMGSTIRPICTVD